MSRPDFAFLVAEILWPMDDPWRSWTPDTLDTVAELVRTLRPELVPSPEAQP